MKKWLEGLTLTYYHLILIECHVWDEKCFENTRIMIRYMCEHFLSVQRIRVSGACKGLNQ